MAGHTYVTKGYSAHTDIPSRNGGYDRGPRKPMYGPVAQVDSAQYTKYSGSPSKIELLKEYVHTPNVSTGPKYASPMRGDGYKGPEEIMDKESNFLGRNKYSCSGPIGSRGPKEVDDYLCKAQTDVGRVVRTDNFSSPNTNVTNDIYKAVSFLKEKIVKSTTELSQKKGGGVLDELSTRVEPVEPARRYARPVFGFTANKTSQNTIDSREAMRKARGTLVP